MQKLTQWVPTVCNNHSGSLVADNCKSRSKSFLAGIGIVLTLIGCLFFAQAQTPPASDIWMGNLVYKNGKIVIQDLVQATDLPGYTNQPYFKDDATLYFTQSMPLDGVDQTDVFRLDIPRLTTHRLTSSSDSEYSPTLMPQGQGLSVIKVNDAGKQELWQLDWQGNPVKNLLPNIEPVGYQVWIDDNRLLLFVLGEPHMLVAADTLLSGTKGNVIDTNIGPSLWRVPNSDFFSYTVAEQYKGQDRWRVKLQHAKYMLNQGIKSVLLPSAGYYYAWTPAGELLTTENGVLMSNDVSSKQGFVGVEGSCTGKVTRIAVSQINQVALVCER